ncbi:hypothetical protein Q9323_14780 [Pseudomonas fulva]|uniref:hypothetical protein n=1 Tax=Pseudomonas fulva TaxID=47880 RepID=UPI0031F63DD2
MITSMIWPVMLCLQSTTRLNVFEHAEKLGAVELSAAGVLMTLGGSHSDELLSVLTLAKAISFALITSSQLLLFLFTSHNR